MPTLDRIGLFGKQAAAYEQITLGELIALLAQREADQGVRFDFCDLKPNPKQIDSYRGFYEHVAIGFLPPDSGEDVLVGQLLEALKAKVGTAMEGYKGGDYTMDASCPLWVANWGHSHGTAILGLEREEYAAIIRTGYR